MVLQCFLWLFLLLRGKYIVKFGHLQYRNSSEERIELRSDEGYSDIKDGEFYHGFLIQKCLFIDIYSNESGGAILIKSFDKNAQILSSIFEKCKTSKQGGAILIVSKVLILMKLVFTECLSIGTKHGGNALNVIVQKMNYHENVIIRCPLLGKIDSYDVAVVKYGIISLVLSNTSHNHPHFQACGFICMNPISYLVHHCIYINNSSPDSLFSVNDLRPDDFVSHCCIINNNLGCIVYLSNSFAILKNCIFGGNNCIIANGDPIKSIISVVLYDCLIDEPVSSAKKWEPIVRCYNMKFNYQHIINQSLSNIGYERGSLTKTSRIEILNSTLHLSQ